MNNASCLLEVKDGWDLMSLEDYIMQFVHTFIV